MLPTMRLIVTLLLLLFTLTVLGEEDPATASLENKDVTVQGEEDPAADALEKKDGEDSTKPSEGQRRTSEPNNPWTRMSPWHFHGYTPYVNWYHPHPGYYYYPPYAGGYQMQPGYASYPGMPQKPLSPLMSLMFPFHMAHSGHPWGIPPHHMPQVTHPGYQSFQPLSPLMSMMYPLHMAYSGHPWGVQPYHMPQAAYPGYPIHLGSYHQYPISPLVAYGAHPWGVQPYHMPQAAYPRYPIHPGSYHQYPISPLVNMMMYPSWHPHPLGAVAHAVHVPGAPTTPTPAHFGWQYPGYYNPYYAHMGYHGHGPVHTGSTFYPHRPQGGHCNFDQTFLCWGMAYCVQAKAMCDGVYDCPNHFDEHPHLCVEGRRPSVESITKFLTDQTSWIGSILPTANDDQIDKTAKALKSAESVDELRWKLSLSQEQVDKLRKAFQAARDDKPGPLVDLSMPSTAMETVKYFFRVLMDTGFRMSA